MLLKTCGSEPPAERGGLGGANFSLPPDPQRHRAAAGAKHI